MKPRQVYFIRPVGAEGPVKIGSSGSPEARLRQCAAMSPVELEIVAVLPGGLDLERRFHALFADAIDHHEWFHATPEVVAVIAAVLSGSFDPSALPPPRRLPQQLGWTEQSRAAARATRAETRLWKAERRLRAA